MVSELNLKAKRLVPAQCPVGAAGGGSLWLNATLGLCCWLTLRDVEETAPGKAHAWTYCEDDKEPLLLVGVLSEDLPVGGHFLWSQYQE